MESEDVGMLFAEKRILGDGGDVVDDDTRQGGYCSSSTTNVGVRRHWCIFKGLDISKTYYKNANTKHFAQRTKKNA